MRGAKARFYNPPIDTPKYIYVIKKVHKRIVEVNIVWADPNLTELVPGFTAISRVVCEDDMFFGDTDWYCAPKDIKLRVQGNS
jgi:hypothetical protein